MPDAPTDTPLSSSRSNPVAWLIILLLSPLFYVLSIGPAVFLHNRVPVLQSTIELIYRPIEKLALSEWGTAFMPLLVRYAELWR